MHLACLGELPIVSYDPNRNPKPQNLNPYTAQTKCQKVLSHDQRGVSHLNYSRKRTRTFTRESNVPADPVLLVLVSGQSSQRRSAWPENVSRSDSRIGCQRVLLIRTVLVGLVKQVHSFDELAQFGLVRAQPKRLLRWRSHDGVEVIGA